MSKSPQRARLSNDRLDGACSIRDLQLNRPSGRSAMPWRLLFIPLLTVISPNRLSSAGVTALFAQPQRLDGYFGPRLRLRGFHGGPDHYVAARSAPTDQLSLLEPSASCSDRWHEGAPVNGVGGGA